MTCECAVIVLVVWLIVVFIVYCLIVATRSFTFYLVDLRYLFIIELNDRMIII